MSAPLGIGGATPYYMPSNHQTAANHTFRDVASFNPRAQTKVKCPSCGVWALRGQPCYLCQRHTTAARRRDPTATGAVTGYNASLMSRPKPRARSPQPRRGAQGPRRGAQGPRASSAALPRERMQNVHAHSFRDTAPRDTSSNVRTKCSSCGCWAKKGQPCYLCRTVNR